MRLLEAEVLALHRDLVSIKSISHDEGPIAQWVEQFLRSHGAEVWRVGENVLARAGTGPRLLFNSHLDTVPPNDGWTRDPWDVLTKDGKVIGLGSNDAKASVAAMISAFLSGGPCEVVLMLVVEEETGGKGTEIAWPHLRDEQGWVPAGVVVGEPTELQIGVAQKGLLVLDLVAKGTPCHSANAGTLGFRNAAFALGEDLVALERADLGPRDPYLGATTLQPTVLAGSTARNQTPAEAKATLDIRTVPGLSHEDLIQRLQLQVKSSLEARSLRLQPYACPPDSPIVRAAQVARAASEPFGSSTMSDQVFFDGVHAIKCGPGVSARSHTADEFVLESEILEGARFYESLIHAFAEVAR